LAAGRSLLDPVSDDDLTVLAVLGLCAVSIELKVVAVLVRRRDEEGSGLRLAIDLLMTPRNS
jgi:hypothetical protein